MLQILNNKTENTHENEQFRRIVKIIQSVFDKYKYEGILIGNPSNDLFYKFQADALLYYTNGLIIFDFKDYSGEIYFPEDEDDFQSAEWYIERFSDQSKIRIKGGSYVNPFFQLKKYREELYNVVNNYPQLNITASKIASINVFSGPIGVKNKVPGKFRFYRLLEEANLEDFIVDFSSSNSFDLDTSIFLKRIFPADDWNISTNNITKIEENTSEKYSNTDVIEPEIIEFLQKDEGGILVLESMEISQRDKWLHFLSEATSKTIPEIESWAHSSRIANRIFTRTNVKTHSIYSVIYGGTTKVEDELLNLEEDNSDDNQDNNLLEIIPIKSNTTLDEKALIIINEAHLVSRSLNQSELLRFGSGRLLEDLIKFLDPKSNRKIIFIGDPYSLSFGKSEDSALELKNLEELYSQSITIYRKPIPFVCNNAKDKTRIDLARGIDDIMFNNLDYFFDNDTLFEVNQSDILHKLNQWFSYPLENEPQQAFLFYSKKDCLKTNLLIKNRFLNNGNDLAKNDLLIANNNITIPDHTGLQIPTKIINGMFFKVIEVLESICNPIDIRQSKAPIELKFVKLKVQCLSVLGKPQTELWILDNFFKSIDGLSKEEKIAFQVFINIKIAEVKKEKKFTDSKFYNDLLNNEFYKNLDDKGKNDISTLINNKIVSKESRLKVETTKEVRALLSYYYKSFEKEIFNYIRETDPFINALMPSYGWAITVHKSIGSFYDEVIVKGHRKDDDGISNESYYRWLYSAFSSSNKRVYITHPQYINPFMNCSFEDLENVVDGNEKVKLPALLTFNNYMIEEKWKPLVSCLNNNNVVGAIVEFSKKIEEKGYKLKSTKLFSDYLNKAFYERLNQDSKDLVVNFDNKGANKNWAVSNIRVETTNSSELEFLENVVNDVLNTTPTIDEETNHNTNQFPTDFRNEIYSHWLTEFDKQGVTIQLLKSSNNQDIFLIRKMNDKLKFQIWYGTSVKNHTRGFFSKIVILEKNTETLVSNLKEIIYGH